MAGERFDAFMRSLEQHVDMGIQDGAIIESSYVNGVQHVRVIPTEPPAAGTTLVWITRVMPEGYTVLEGTEVATTGTTSARANVGWFNVPSTSGTGTRTATSGPASSDPVCGVCERPVPSTAWRAVLRAGPDVPADRWYHLRCAPAETEVLEPKPETD